ncbi:MAG: hypothetical protein ACMUIG_10770 [Thermoplasmatota archaeon]
MLILWGAAHLFPTKNVVKDFGEISRDNKLIITMEWIIEGFALIFMGALIAIITMVDHEALVSSWVYWFTIVSLIILSVISLFTGFRVKFIVFKLCPVIFSTAAIFILIGNIT